jgi:hypothetical protein
MLVQFPFSLVSPSISYPSSDCSPVDSEEEHKKKVKLDKKNYKTEICKNWQMLGRCSYGIKCQFAHGETERIKKKEKPTYKSKLCQAFHKEFYCPYGVRCLFIHEKDFNFTKSFFRRSLNGGISDYQKRLLSFSFPQNSDFSYFEFLEDNERGDFSSYEQQAELFEITRKIAEVLE